jgi:hypothetical protein
MLRVLTALLLTLALFAIPSRAETFKDPSGRFDVSVPAGWQATKIDDARIMTFALAHPLSQTAPFEAFCLGMFSEIAESRSLKQEELNEALEGQLTTEFWRKAINSSGDQISMTVDSAGSRSQSGRAIHYVVFTGTGERNGKKEAAKGRMELHFVPGAMHFVMCIAMAASYDAASADFATIFTSYVPHVDVLVSRNETAPSVLTMFAEANFKGVARVLSQDTANLAAAGWPTTSASLVVDGAAPWQVCSGLAYSGMCQTIVAANAGLTGRPILIRSARRIDGNAAFANVAATAVRRALQTPRTRAILHK